MYLTFVLSFALLAQGPSAIVDDRKQETELRQQEIRQQMEGRRQEVELRRQETRQQAEEIRVQKVDDRKQETELRQQEIRQQMEGRRQEVELRRQETRQQAEEIRVQKAEEVRQHREELRQQATDRLDERRAQAVERLSQRVNFINDKLTDGYFHRLDSFVNVLDKMVLRADRMTEERGLDVSSARLKIDAAYAAVNTARERVLEQKTKIYVVSLENVEAVGQAMSSAIRELRADHNRLRDETIMPLRERLKSVLEELKNAIVAAENNSL